jgi:hypothetical protein
LIGGLISIVLVNTPFLNLINLLLCAGFWIGPLVAILLYRRLSGAITRREAIITGLLAGAWHGLIGLMLSPLGMTGAGGLLKDITPFLSGPDLANLKISLTGMGGLIFNVFGVVIDLAFGFLAGLVSGAIFRTDRKAITAGAQK